MTFLSNFDHLMVKSGLKTAFQALKRRFKVTFDHFCHFGHFLNEDQAVISKGTRIVEYPDIKSYIQWPNTLVAFKCITFLRIIIRYYKVGFTIRLNSQSAWCVRKTIGPKLWLNAWEIQRIRAAISIINN